MAFPLVFILISLVLIMLNGSFVFEREFISKYGDQQLYYQLAHGVLDGSFPKSLYTLGYPLLYIPLMTLTGVREHWTSIMPLLISLQSFVLMPAAIYLTFKDKAKNWALYSFGLLSIYYAVFLLTSQDILIKYNFFGLIPLSEPLAIFCLIASYYVYLHYVRVKTPRTKHIILLSGLLALSLLTRNTSTLLFLPIGLDLLWDRRFKLGLLVGAITGAFYMPQLIYNYLCSGDPLFNGYVWWANNRVEKNTRNIEALYGIRSSAMFVWHYLSVNLRELVLGYLPVIMLSCLALLKRNRFVMLVVLCTLINTVFHLAYWWSQAGDLIHRFLLPNIFLLLFVLQNKQIKAVYENN